ncbi:enoyl-CoA hydratase-related protein [Halopseudomonas sp.]|uniref:enoyl-CoA hydratase-related protein n=1 Tax=Halopseudomonas sp. TaxID=2901191 RepID=UPI00311D597F
MTQVTNPLALRERELGPFSHLELQQAASSPWQHWRLRRDDNDIAWLLFDHAGSSTNLLSVAAMTELGDALASLRRDMPKALVLRSAKPAGFCMGADLKDFSQLGNEADAVRQLVDAHLLAQQLIDLPCPTLAVLHGETLGGGLELALCCDMRLATPDTRTGLPEILVGLHPGLGATARLPDLIDPLLAMRMMLTGKALKAEEAHKAGLVDQVAPEHQLRPLIDAALNGRLTLHRRNLKARPFRLDWVRRLAAVAMRRQASAKADPRHYPAAEALIDLWQRHGGKPDLLLHREIYSFARLINTPTSRHLIQLFFQRQRLKALGTSKENRRRSHLHLLGAGDDGTVLAALAALSGLRVSVGGTTADMAACIKQIRLHARSDAQQQRALDGLIYDPEHHGAALADALIDAQQGELEPRREQLQKLESRLRPQALVLSFADPVEPLRAALNDAGRLLSLRFAAPEYGALVEVAAHSTSRNISQQHARQLIGQLGCLPLPVSSQPGLLLRRVLAPWLLEAMLLVEEGVNVDAIEQAAITFGCSRGPLAIAEHWGLSNCLALFERLHNERDTPLAEPPAILRNAVEQGRSALVSAKRSRWKGNKKMTKLSAEHDDRLLLSLLNSAVRACRQGIVSDADMLDAALVLAGYFPPFRGGPLCHARETGHAEIIERLHTLSRDVGPRFAPDPGWQPAEAVSAAS